MSKVTGTMRIKEDQDATEQLEITLTVDFAGATPQQMAEWAFANRKIAFANMLRQNWDDNAMTKAVDTGMTVLAVNASAKVETPAQTKAKVAAMLETGQLTKADLLAMLQEA